MCLCFFQESRRDRRDFWALKCYHSSGRTQMLLWGYISAKAIQTSKSWVICFLSSLFLFSFLYFLYDSPLLSFPSWKFFFLYFVFIVSSFSFIPFKIFILFSEEKKKKWSVFLSSRIKRACQTLSLLGESSVNHRDGTQQHLHKMIWENWALPALLLKPPFRVMENNEGWNIQASF